MKTFYRTEPDGEEAKSGGCCRSSEQNKELPPEIAAKVKTHPCYSEEAHHHFARMHVAVAPACNMQCNYCNRKYDCANESRPGVSSERLTPEEALLKVEAVAARIPQLSVVGIAGPGDPLANPEKTFRTFELLDRHLPDLKLCLSTNGLMLPEYIEKIKKYNIDHVTITINMIDPDIGEKIYPWIHYRGRRWRGRDAAEIITENQLLGLELLTSAGILCKINSVLISDVNDEHLVEVNRAITSRGAFLHNIMPLIAKPEHGTYFGQNGQREPTSEELNSMQDRLSVNSKVMRHCRQCRADAVGLLGEDRNSEFTLEKINNSKFRREDRSAERSLIHREILSSMEESKQRLDIVENQGKKESEKIETPIVIAVVTKGGGIINEHFGHAREFLIYKVSNREIVLTGVRSVDNYCKGGFGNEESLSRLLEMLAGCHGVLVAKIGECPRDELNRAEIAVSDDYAFHSIQSSLLNYSYQIARELKMKEYAGKDRLPG